MRQIFIIGLCVLVMCSVASAQEEWMPDPNLRQAVRAALELPDGVPLTQLEMKRLTLDAADKNRFDWIGTRHEFDLARSWSKRDPRYFSVSRVNPFRSLMDFRESTVGSFSSGSLKTD